MSCDKSDYYSFTIYPTVCCMLYIILTNLSPTIMLHVVVLRMILALAGASVQALSIIPESSTSSSSSRRDFIDKTLALATITAATTTTTTSTYPAFAEEVSSIGKPLPLSLPPLGLGAWAWGDSLFWG